ncbi:TIGR03086 family metal-binding protein [Planobispora takensis]|uniref:TIGR03086 family protein n=1 Tax=Planobispora takensis TaxID=1367882 RepID=A0A8J3SZX6_9ACTN|nr:TIGR03086 family metal-binding protein [Planobispora takensis]GII01440.1 TIGR03086 family protein [Planobispora takensis]
MMSGSSGGAEDPVPEAHVPGGGGPYGVTADRYRRLAAAFAAKLEGVGADGWDDPTPCTDWSVGELVGHVVAMHEVHLFQVNRRPLARPDVERDPLGAFAVIRDQVQADLDDRGRAQEMYTGRFGRWTFAEGIDRAICTELVVHGWDLARATGQDDRIDPVEIRRVRAALMSIGHDVVRGMMAGPEVEAGPDADEQTRLLAYLGRRR